MSWFALPLRPCEAADEMAAEGFSVEDLLDLDKDELCERAPAGMEEERSRGSSAVSYELMPPPAMDLPAHDAEEQELEWVSRILDDSLAEIPQPICALSMEAAVPRVRAKRSKRLRATGWSLSGAALSDAVSSSPTASSCCSSSSFFPPDMDLLDEPLRRPNRPKPKKRGRKPKHHPPPSDRRCSHCGVQKTPQWRAGPAGAKTLCNACGVRFKSGRLLPEYRPAMSPTFVRNLHSNSHRKVLEMRRPSPPSRGCHRPC